MELVIDDRNVTKQMLGNVHREQCVYVIGDDVICQDINDFCLPLSEPSMVFNGLGKRKVIGNLDILKIGCLGSERSQPEWIIEIESAKSVAHFSLVIDDQFDLRPIDMKI